MPTASSHVANGSSYPMAYAYDLAGTLTSFTFPSLRQQSINCDSAGRISGVTGAIQSAGTTYASLTSSDAYFPNRAIQDMRVGPNAFVQQSCQNNRLQIAGVRQAPLGGRATSACANSGTGTSGDPLNLAMTYGAAGTNNGNVTAETIQTGNSGMSLNVTQNFTYDAYERLLTASETGSWSQNYGYDAYGNRWVASGYLPAASSTPKAAGDFNSANNRFAASMAAGGTHVYDPGGSGNLTGTNGSTFTYDAENRQLSANI
jgi:YD repeat-containing protein